MRRMEDLLAAIRGKTAELDRLRPLAGAALLQPQIYYEIDLIYADDAIEGNMLTHRGTAEVIEHGTTAGGKKSKHHFESAGHYAEVLWMRGLAAGSPNHAA